MGRSKKYPGCYFVCKAKRFWAEHTELRRAAEKKGFDTQCDNLRQEGRGFCKSCYDSYWLLWEDKWDLYQTWWENSRDELNAEDLALPYNRELLPGGDVPTPGSGSGGQSEQQGRRRPGGGLPPQGSASSSWQAQQQEHEQPGGDGSSRGSGSQQMSGGLSPHGYPL